MMKLIQQFEMLLIVDVAESEGESAKEFFTEYKEDWKIRFDQIVEII